MMTPESSKSKRTLDNYLFNKKIYFSVVQDHILESQCRHVEGLSCQVCKYEKELSIPHLPEMIFPNNTLTLSLKIGDECERLIVQFNAFDALSLVEVGRFPDVKVKPSEVWQKARKKLPLHSFQKPFDWTYTSAYKGTILAEDVRVEPTDEAIDFERLKQREPILFYSQITLYEDELSDHGCSRMSIRVRIMPTSFFILCRFYLRIDDVLVRSAESRFFGKAGCSYIIREWSRSEAFYEQIDQKHHHFIHDENRICEVLPRIELERTKLTFDCK